jgi:hypothetical protein
MKWTIKETINYTKRFYHVLDTGDASPLLSLSPRVKQHAMTSLANWAKYTGQYDKFQQIKQRYNLNWLKVDSTIHLQRFFNEGLTLDVMIQRIRQMIRLLPERMAKIIKYACLEGLRASEVLESVKVINNGDKEAFVQYYDSVQLTLNHWKLPGMIRSTKKAFLSFITPQMLQIVQNIDKVPTLNAITPVCRHKGIKMEMYLCRKIFASWLRKEGIAAEAVMPCRGEYRNLS